jgi:diguanylate cyclase (GGDEF)-like protein
MGGLVGTILDITERKQTEERLRYMSTHDPLTGLYNRAYFQEEMERLEQGRQFPVSVVVFDVDRLKFVNDNLGHAAGDELLVRAALVLKGAFRAEDVVARIGGDEFAVLLPSADAEVVKEALRRVVGKIEQNHGEDHSVQLSISFGAATACKGDRLEETLKLADRRMYENKFNKSGVSPA